MKKSGENEANVAPERARGGVDGNKARASRLSEKGRRCCSMTENPVFSISYTDCDWALFTTLPALSLYPISRTTMLAAAHD